MEQSKDTLSLIATTMMERNRYLSQSLFQTPIASLSNNNNAIIAWRHSIECKKLDN